MPGLVGAKARHDEVERGKSGRVAVEQLDNAALVLADARQGLWRASLMPCAFPRGSRCRDLVGCVWKEAGGKRGLEGRREHAPMANIMVVLLRLKRVL